MSLPTTASTTKTSSSSSSLGNRKKSSMLAWARMVAGRRIAKKRREAQTRNLQRLEYKRLKDLVPWLRRKTQLKEKVSKLINISLFQTKVEVIENTIKYIDQLHKALAEKIQQQQQQADEEVELSPDEAGHIAHMMFREDVHKEKMKTWPSPADDSTSSTFQPTSATSSSSPLPSSSSPTTYESTFRSLQPPPSGISSASSSSSSSSTFPSSRYPRHLTFAGSWNARIKQRRLPSYLVQSNVLQDMSDSYKSRGS